MNLRIKDICKEKGMTLQQVAEAMGVNRVSLSNSINGNPTIGTLEKIAVALGVEIVELFDAHRGDFTALIDHRGKLYRFDSIEALNVYISPITK